MAQTIKLKRSATAGGIPTTSQLELGEVAINTTDGKMYIKKSVGGVETIVDITGGGSSADTILEEFQFTASSNQTTFSGSDDNSETFTYTPNAIQVFLNGILLDYGVDYTATNGTSVVLAETVDANDYLQVFAFKQKISDGSVSVNTFTGNGSTTAFTLSINPGDENNTRVFVDGVYQSKSNYAVSGTTLTFSTAPPTGTAIEVEIGNRNVTLDTTANLDFPDNVKMRLGTSQDLEIFHDGSNSYVKETGPGALVLQSAGPAIVLEETDGTNMILANTGGAVTLYHAGSSKLETTSTGVNVQGTIANTSGNMILDSTSDILLDADGGNIMLRDNSVWFGNFNHNGNNLAIDAKIQDGDLVFRGNDGGSTITALTLDMSAAGAATFSSSISTVGAITGGTLSAGTGSITGGSLNVDNISINGSSITSSSNLNLTSSNNDIILDTGQSDIILRGSGSEFGRFFTSSNNFYIKSAISNADLIIQGNDGGVSTNVLTFDMSQAGRATFNEGIILKSSSAGDFGVNINTLSGDSMKLQVVDTGSAGAAHGSIAVSDGNLTLDVAGNINLDADGANVYFNDGGTERYRFKLDATPEINVTGGTFTLKNNTSDADILFSGNDGGSAVTALTLDMSNSGKATFNHDVAVGGSLSITDSGQAQFGTGNDMQIYHNGAAGEINNVTGHFTIDSAGEIILDSDAEIVRIYHDGGWVGGFQLTNNDFIIRSAVSDKDLIFKGNDGGSTITALTLDMSDAGSATFNNHISLGDNKQLKFGASNDVIFYHNPSNNNFQIYNSNTSGGTLIQNNGSAGGIALQPVINENAIYCAPNGAVQLYHNGSSKLQTTSTGITVSETSSGNLMQVASFVNPVGTANTGVRLWLSGTNTTTRGTFIDAVAESTANIHSLRFGTSASASAPIERMRIEPTGTIAVSGGGASISPTIKHSGVDAYLSKLRLVNRSGQASNKGGLLELGGVTNDEVTRSDVFASLAGLKSTNTSNNRTGYMQFSTNSGSALVEHMRIDSSGNVGIGESNPAEKLDVAGRIKSDDGLLSNHWQLYNTGTNGFLIGTSIAANNYGHIHGEIKLQRFNANTQQIINFSATVSSIAQTVHTKAATADIDVTIKMFVYSGVWYFWVPSPSTYTDISAYIHLGNGYQGGSRSSNAITALSNAGVPSSGVTNSVDIVAQKRILANTAGNVGIGTSTPQKKFHVEHTAGASEGILISGSSDTVGHTAGILLRAEGGEADSALRAKAGIFLERVAGSYGVGKLHIANRHNSDNVSATTSDANITIYDDKIGIGTTSPSNMLSVNGVITSGNFTASGISGSIGDANTAELGPGYLVLARDDTADASQIRFGKNGAVHSYLETRTNGLGFITNVGNFAFEGGNVGIGNPSPFAPLHVKETGWSSGSPYGTVQLIEGKATNDHNWSQLVITDTDDSNGNGGAISFATGASSALNPFASIKGFRQGTNHGALDFYTRPSGGTATSRMRIDSAGTVGIGTTDLHTWAAFDGRLRLGAKGVYATTAASTQMGYNWYYDSGSNYRYIAADVANRYYQNGGNHVWETAASGSADGVITWTEKMRIDSGGRLGINQTPLTNNFALQVTGLGGGSNDARAVYLKGTGNHTSIGSTGPTLTLQNTNSTANNIVKLSFESASSGETVSINAINTNHSSHYGDMAFNTRGSAGYSEKMRIMANGRVGIGKTNPSYLVHAQNLTATGPSYIATSANNQFIMAIGSQNSPGVAQEAFVGTLSDTRFKIKVNNTVKGSWTDNGLAIGTQSSAYTNLDVAGQIAMSIGNAHAVFSSDSSGRVYIKANENCVNAATSINMQMPIVSGSGSLEDKLVINHSDITAYEHFLPSSDNTYDLGTAAKRWRNIYTGDLHLSNETQKKGNDVDGTKGNWTVQEGEENLYLINNKTGKKYKFALEEIE